MDTTTVDQHDLTPENIQRHVNNAHALRSKAIAEHLVWAFRFTGLCMAALRSRKTLDSADLSQITRSCDAARQS